MLLTHLYARDGRHAAWMLPILFVGAIVGVAWAMLARSGEPVMAMIGCGARPRRASRAVAEGGDGLGQGLLDEWRWYGRFRRAGRMSIPWRHPEPADEERVARHPGMTRFGDATTAVACFEGRHWVLRERDWSGWPDPPRYVVFALEGEAIRMAWDFDHLPRAWPMP